jgi:hypothetical protein
MPSSQELKRPSEKVNAAASGDPHIRSRAYGVYQQCGGEEHQAIEDWLQAEADSMPKKEIKSEKGNHKAA